MRRMLVAFVRREREEIAAMLPALFRARAWPREIWLMLFLAGALVPAAWPGILPGFDPRGVALVVSLAVPAQFLLARAHATPWARAWGFLVLFALPISAVPLLRGAEDRARRPASVSVPFRFQAELREVCIKAPSRARCRWLVRTYPELLQSLTESELQKAWQTASLPLLVGHYEGNERMNLERQLAQAREAFRAGNFSLAQEVAESIGLLLDEPEIHFIKRASRLAQQVQDEDGALATERRLTLFERRLHQRRLASLERDGEALRWSAPNDPRARSKMLSLAVTLRSRDPGNKKALEWMRELGVRK